MIAKRGMRFSTAYEQVGSRKALDATGRCSGSSAHRRFQEWTQAGVFQRSLAQGLLDDDELKGIEWEWQAMDGVMTKAPLGQEQTGPNPTDRAKRGVKRSLLVEGHGVPLGVAVDGANRNDAQDTASNAGKYSH